MKTKHCILQIIATISLLTIGACKPTANTGETPTNTANETTSLPADSKNNSQSAKGPIIVFDEETHDFGTVIQGEKVFYSFRFVNTGDDDLIISMAQGSCGCTVPTFPKEPIKPGKEGKINVVFNSENLMGISEKTITVISNSNPSGLTRLKIQSNIIVPKEKK